MAARLKNEFEEQYTRGFTTTKQIEFNTDYFQADSEQEMNDLKIKIIDSFRTELEVDGWDI